MLTTSLLTPVSDTTFNVLPYTTGLFFQRFSISIAPRAKIRRKIEFSTKFLEVSAGVFFNTYSEHGRAPGAHFA